MKKILFLDNNLHFNGGGEKVACQMANRFFKDGNQVTILSISSRKDNETFPLEEGINLDYLNVPSIRTVGSILTVFRLIKYLKKNRFDYVFGIGTNANVYLGFASRMCSDVRFIGCEHNSFDIVKGIWGTLRKISYPHLDATVVLTNSDFAKMKTLNPKTYTIPNSIDLGTIRSDLSKKNFIAIGRLSYQKAFDDMIDAFLKFSKYDSEWELLIIGDGKDKVDLINRINDYGLSNRIRLISFTHNIMDYYKQSSIYLMTSRFEGLPLVLLEAQSCGIPIISYDCDTGPRDIIRDGENGFLIKNRDQDLFVKRMLELSRDNQLRLNMQEKAIKNLEKFSPSKIFEKWYYLMDSI